MAGRRVDDLQDKDGSPVRVPWGEATRAQVVRAYEWAAPGSEPLSVDQVHGRVQAFTQELSSPTITLSAVNRLATEVHTAYFNGHLDFLIERFWVLLGGSKDYALAALSREFDPSWRTEQQLPDACSPEEVLLPDAPLTSSVSFWQLELAYLRDCLAWAHRHLIRKCGTEATLRAVGVHRSRAQGHAALDMAVCGFLSKLHSSLQTALPEQVVALLQCWFSEDMGTAQAQLVADAVRQGHGVPELQPHTSPSHCFYKITTQQERMVQSSILMWSCALTLGAGLPPAELIVIESPNDTSIACCLHKKSWRMPVALIRGRGGQPPELHVALLPDYLHAFREFSGPLEVVPDAPTEIVAMQGTKDGRGESSEPKLQTKAVRRHWQRAGRLRKGQQTQDSSLSPKLSRGRSSNAFNKLREQLLVLAQEGLKGSGIHVRSMLGDLRLTLDKYVTNLSEGDAFRQAFKLSDANRLAIGIEALMQACGASSEAACDSEGFQCLMLLCASAQPVDIEVPAILQSLSELSEGTWGMAAFQAAAPGDGAATACLSRLRDMALSPANAPAALALLCEEQLLAASGIWPREDEAQGSGVGAVAVTRAGPEWAEVLGNTRARVQRIGEHVRLRQLAESSMQTLLEAEMLEKEQGKGRAERKQKRKQAGRGAGSRPVESAAFDGIGGSIPVANSSAANRDPSICAAAGTGAEGGGATASDLSLTPGNKVLPEGPTHALAAQPDAPEPCYTGSGECKLGPALIGSGEAQELLLKGTERVPGDCASWPIPASESDKAQPQRFEVFAWAASMEEHVGGPPESWETAHSKKTRKAAQRLRVTPEQQPPPQRSPRSAAAKTRAQLRPSPSGKQLQGRPIDSQKMSQGNYRFNVSPSGHTHKVPSCPAGATSSRRQLNPLPKAAAAIDTLKGVAAVTGPPCSEAQDPVSELATKAMSSQPSSVLQLGSSDAVEDEHAAVTTPTSGCQEDATVLHSTVPPPVPGSQPAGTSRSASPMDPLKLQSADEVQPLVSSLAADGPHADIQSEDNQPGLRFLEFEPTMAAGVVSYALRPLGTAGLRVAVESKDECRLVRACAPRHLLTLEGCSLAGADL